MSRRRPGTGVHAGITGTGAAEEPNNAMEVRLMDTTMNNIRPDTSNPADDARQHSAASRPAGRPGDDVVRRREFRQAQWLVGIALAAILGSQGFLYAAIVDLQRDVQTQIGGLRTELHTEIGGLRTELHTEIGGLRAEMRTEIRGLRAELHTEINGLRADMQAQFADLRDEIAVLREHVRELSERVARIETRLDMDAGPAVPPG